MKTLNQQELHSLEQFFKLKQPQLLRAMKQYLSSKYEKVISKADYLIAVGDLPVALVAHLDTVFKTPPHDIYYDKNKNVMWSPDGLGADDRAGVYSIIQIIKAGYRPTVIFVTDEEIGCIGAMNLAREIDEPPAAINYIIELDRRGSDDCVFYDCRNYKFESYIESFGFVTNFGSFSDISVICPNWGIAGVNLSIGYYNEHSFIEHLNISQMFNTISKVKKMLDVSKESEPFEYIPVFKKNYKLTPTTELDDSGWDPSYGISREDWLSFMEPQSKCCICGKWDYDYNLFPVKNSGETIMYCSDCICDAKDVHWCSICGEAFKDDKYSIHCEDCRGKINV